MIKIKNKCSICGARINNGIVRYNIYGNTCMECSKRVVEVVQKRMTEEQADKDVEERRKKVKRFNL